MKMRLGQRIKRFRKNGNISADEVASKLGISRSTMFRYENGEIQKIPIDHLEGLSNIFNISITELLNEPTLKSLEDYTNEELLTELNQLMDELNRRLTPYESNERFTEVGMKMKEHPISKVNVNESMCLRTNLKKIRKEKGITQRNLSKLTDLSYSMISKIESGEQSNPSFDTLLMLSNALDVELSELLKCGDANVQY